MATSINIKDTKFLRFDLLKKEVVVSLPYNKQTVMNEDTVIRHTPGLGYSGYSANGHAFNSQIGRQISRLIKFIDRSNYNDLYKIKFDRLVRGSIKLK